jgi:hypothetical protein
MDGTDMHTHVNAAQISPAITSSTVYTILAERGWMDTLPDPTGIQTFNERSGMHRLSQLQGMIRDAN